MGGGGCIPEALSHKELAAWSQNTGNPLTPWEVRALKTMDRSWRRVYGDKKEGATLQHQGVGDHCRGEEVDSCRERFREQLELVCSTCPN